MRSFILAAVLLAGCECQEWAERPAQRCVSNHSETQYLFSLTDGKYHLVSVKICDQYQSYTEQFCRSYK